MILDDLFEQKPLPAHIKPSDLPPAMRSRLTMRDVEQERPRGAYRYRVTPSKAGESPKDFLDLPGAEQYAQAVGGRVTPLEEQANDPDIQRGMINLNAIEKQQNTNIKVMWQNETGQPAFMVELPVDKQWLIGHAQEWIDAGRSNDLYKLMGTRAGQDFLLKAWQKEDDLRMKREKDVQPEEPDLFGIGQAGGPKSPRYQDESQSTQKKSPDLTEEPRGASARTTRMMTQMRARQPQAASDLEALAYELQDAERRDAEEINKLEREVDDLETDIKSDLQKRIATLTKRRGGIRQAAATDTKIDATLDQLAQVNDQQQRDIDSLTKAVASLGQRSAAPAVASSPVSKQPAQPTSSPAIGQAVQTLTRPAGETPTSSGGTVTTTPTGVVHRGRPQEPKPATSKLQRAPAAAGDRISRLAVSSDSDKGVQDELFKQAAESALEEKKRPQPTNPDLWSRAKSAARSKFDVYPSAYANAWAAKWYKSKGGGWRMGKPKKK